MLKFRWLTALLLACATSASSAEPLVDKLLRLAGLTANPPAQTKAPGEQMETGDIWLVVPDQAPTQLTSDGGYRSPIFSPADGSLLALKGGKVVCIRGTSHVEVVVSAPSVIKLVGIDPAKPNEVVVLHNGAAPLAVLSLKTGKLTLLPYDANSKMQQRMLAQMRGQERTYGTTRLYVKTESKRGMARILEWTDVYLRRGDGALQNVSACDGVNCGEPALSPDGRTVAFVKSGN